MIVRLRQVRQIAKEKFRLTLDLVDSEPRDWGPGDCVVQVDLLDAPQHQALPRGPLEPALDLYRLSPDAPPASTDARLLWEMGPGVDAYVTRVFDAGIACPFEVPAKDGAPERSS